MTALEVTGVKKNYCQRTVFQGSVHFEPGKLYGLLGPNASGKSTLLKIIAGVEKPDCGEVRYHCQGQWQSHGPEVAKRMVLVPDRKGLFHDTVLNNVLYGLRIRKIAKKTRLAAAAHALSKVGLYDLRKQSSLGLSNGESQRLCLAMAMAVDPEIILLDEPTSSLDPASIAQVETIINDLKQPGRTIILVTHDLHQAKRLADEGLLLINGEIAAKGSCPSFFENPENERARRFLAGELVG